MFLSFWVCICVFGHMKLNLLQSFCCFSVFVSLSADADDPSVSVVKWNVINWCLLSYLNPTAVPEAEESDEALFCWVRVTAGAVCTG